MEELKMIPPSKDFLNALEKENILKEKELVLNEMDTKNILKATDIVRDLKIKLEARLNVSDEDNIAIKNFVHALKQLPKQLSLDVGIDGSFGRTGD
jgi:hypothetical protein